MSVNRRNLLAAGGALAVAATVAGQGIAAGSKNKATYVLVHGGGHGGWCWKRVADPLRAAGHDVYAPSMTGLADRSHLVTADTNLDTHITDIVNLLKWEDLTNVILVGHSYGGMVITGVADRALDRVGHLVYLDAAHPKNGDPLFKLPAPGATTGGGGAGGSPNAAGMPRKVNGVDLMMFPNEELVKGPLGVTDPKDVAWMMAKLTPHPVKCFTQPLRLENEAAVRNIPSTDIWRAAILNQQRSAGAVQPSSNVRLWSINSTSHNLMVTEPKQVTDMLLKVAAL